MIGMETEAFIGLRTSCDCLLLGLEHPELPKTAVDANAGDPTLPARMPMDAGVTTSVIDRDGFVQTVAARPAVAKILDPVVGRDAVDVVKIQTVLPPHHQPHDAVDRQLCASDGNVPVSVHVQIARRLSRRPTVPRIARPSGGKVGRWPLFPNEPATEGIVVEKSQSACLGHVSHRSLQCFFRLEPVAALQRSAGSSNILLLLVLFLFASALLSACQTASGRSVVVAPRLAQIPQALKLPCDDATDIPARDLTSEEVARLWGRDRQALGACRDRHDALAAAANAGEGQGAR